MQSWTHAEAWTSRFASTSDGSPNHWGIPELGVKELEDTDRDSLLILRQIVITDLACLGNAKLGLSAFREHLEDPVDCSKSPMAARCSSIRVTEAHSDIGFQ